MWSCFSRTCITSTPPNYAILREARTNFSKPKNRILVSKIFTFGVNGVRAKDFLPPPDLRAFLIDRIRMSEDREREREKERNNFVIFSRADRSEPWRNESDFAVATSGENQARVKWKRN